MPGADGEEVPADVVLTQLGHVKMRCGASWSRINISFRCGLAATDEGYLSLIEGRLSVGEAVALVARGDEEGTADCVRHTEAGSLTKSGFRVVYRPLRTIPGHVAVYPGGEWDEETSKLFDDCFVDYVRGLFL
jgi:hypothetical protein